MLPTGAFVTAMTRPNRLTISLLLLIGLFIIGMLVQVSGVLCGIALYQSDLDLHLLGQVTIPRGSHEPDAFFEDSADKLILADNATQQVANANWRTGTTTRWHGLNDKKCGTSHKPNGIVGMVNNEPYFLVWKCGQVIVVDKATLLNYRPPLNDPSTTAYAFLIAQDRQWVIVLESNKPGGLVNVLRAGDFIFLSKWSLSADEGNILLEPGEKNMIVAFGMDTNTGLGSQCGIRFRDILSGEFIREWHFQDNIGQCAAWPFFVTGNILLGSQYSPDSIRKWNLQDGSYEGEFIPSAGTGPIPQMQSLSISRDGRFVAVADSNVDMALDYDRRVNIWDLQTGRSRYTIRRGQHPFGPVRVRFSPYSDEVAFIYDDCVRIFSYKMPK